MQPIDHVRARPRTYLAALVVLILAWALPGTMAWSTRLLVAWDAGVCVWLVAVTILMIRSDTARMRQRASAEDSGAVAILLASSAAAVASLIAIAVELSGMKQADFDHRAFHLSLTGITVLFSWLFVHLSFTLHYAHQFYGEAGDQHGLGFPGPKRAVDYWDFAYFALTVGATSQTSDVEVLTPGMRRIVLAHAVLAFFFNTMVLALGVNVGASLL